VGTPQKEVMGVPARRFAALAQVQLNKTIHGRRAFNPDLASVPRPFRWERGHPAGGTEAWLNHASDLNPVACCHQGNDRNSPKLGRLVGPGPRIKEEINLRCHNPQPGATGPRKTRRYGMDANEAQSASAIFTARRDKGEMPTKGQISNHGCEAHCHPAWPGPDGRV
jgi:hypothetical protein